MSTELAWRNGYVTPRKPSPPATPPMPAHSPDIIRTQPMSSRALASMGEHKKALSRAHVLSLKRYKSDSSSLNKLLRAGDRNVEDRDAERLKVVASHAMPSHQTSYRGDQFSHILPVGHRLTDRGFASTSLNPHIADQFSLADHGYQDKTLAIHAPPETRAYHVDANHPKITNASDEDEHLLHPDTHFEVIGHSSHPISSTRPQAGRHLVTHLAVIGQGRDERGRPDLSLTRSPEGREWLKRMRRHHVTQVTT